MYDKTKTRLNQLFQKLEEKSLDAFLITEPHNVFYLTSCWAEGTILLTSRENFFLTTSLFAEEVEKKMGSWEIVVQKDSFEETLGKIWKGLDGKRIGFEAAHLSYQRYQKLSQLKEKELIPCSGLVENLRVVKDEEELSSIKKALQITRATFAYLESLLKMGISEREICTEAVYFMRKRADEEAFPPIVLFEERASLPHGKPGQRKLKRDELVLLDLGARVDGYCSNLTRTLFFGKLQERWQKIHSLIIQAQKEAIEEIRPGIKSSRIDEVARERIKKAGYLQAFLHGTGHGVGLEVHEQPTISSRSREVLKKGTVITIEPGIYLPGEGGVREEKMVLVTEKGREIL